MGDGKTTVTQIFVALCNGFRFTPDMAKKQPQPAQQPKDAPTPGNDVTGPRKHMTARVKVSTKHFFEHTFPAGRKVDGCGQGLDLAAEILSKPPHAP